MKAIAAMSLNRVIGAGNKIPWHLPEDFKWFKQMTTGHIIVMGRKTFESIGRPLPNRTTLVLTRSPVPIPGVQTLAGLDQLEAGSPTYAGREVFICGGAQVYEQALPLCSDLYLTLVNRVVEGDTFFPPFEEQFKLEAELLARPEFRVLHYRRLLNR
jgi:dihydrofolate reductase